MKLFRENDHIETWLMSHKDALVLVLILLLAFFLRGYHLTQSPPSLYWEEAALGYDAYSILKTGKDYHGNAWPLVAFESFGDWKPSGYFYILVPFVAVLGLTETAVRLPSVMAGVLTVWLVYLITRELYTNKTIAIWSALMIAIMPWHIQFSRAGFEVNVATLWLTLGLWCLLKARKKAWLWLPGTLALAASMYTYHGLRVLAPLTALWTLIVFKPDFTKYRYIAASLFLAIILVWPLLNALTSPQIQQRFKETSLLSTSPAVRVTNADRTEDNYRWWSRISHHRYIEWSKEVAGGIISHFNPQFIFLEGDTNPRHQVKGLLYGWMVIPLLIGLTQLNKRPGWFLGGWVMLATIPPALTNLTPHTLRFLPAAPAVAIILGLGIVKVKTLTWLFRVLLFLIIFTLFTYAYTIWQVYPRLQSQSWQYGYKQAIEAIRQDYVNGKTIYFTRDYGRPSIYAMFYLKLDPREIQHIASTVSQDQGELLEINQLAFTTQEPLPNSVIVTSKPTTAYRWRQTITFLDGKPAFYIYEY